MFARSFVGDGIVTFGDGRRIGRSHQLGIAAMGQMDHAALVALVEEADARRASADDRGSMATESGPDAAWDDKLTRLIQHGRDREAAELASLRFAPSTRGAFLDPRHQLDEILPLVTTLVEQLDESQLDAPTACDKFAVRQILEHMIGGATRFAAAFRGASPAAVEPQNLVAEFPIAIAELRAAMQSPGALDRTVAAPFGEVPGKTFARFVALDGLVHGWDIASATGQPYDPPAAVVEAVEAFARQALPDMRDGDTFAAAVEPPVGASPLVRLVAFTGRKV